MTIANVEMAQAWDGEEGERWAQHADRYEATGRRYRQRLLEAASVSDDHRVLDIGCGAGRSTRDAARLASAGSALGVDLSSRMLELARQRSLQEGLTNVSFLQADAQVHPFEPGGFDLAISSFGAMFFADPVAAFANIGQGMRPGARLAVLAWREMARNEWLAALWGALAAGRVLPEPAAGVPGPFGLAVADDVRGILGRAGFHDVELEAVDEQLELGADVDDAFGFVRTLGIVKGLTEGLDEKTTASALEEVRALLAAHQTAEGVVFGSSSWLITARRP